MTLSNFFLKIKEASFKKGAKIEFWLLTCYFSKP